MTTFILNKSDVYITSSPIPLEDFVPNNVDLLKPNYFICDNIDLHVTAPPVIFLFNLSSISSDLNADVYMTTTYPASTLNNSFLIYANDITDIQNMQVNNLKFCVNPPPLLGYNNILPQCSNFIITSDPSYCGYLSELSLRSLGYEYLSYLSNQINNTQKDFIKFIETGQYIRTVNNYVDTKYSELLSNMSQPTDSSNNVSQEIFISILNDSSRLTVDISNHYLGSNLYSNFLLPNDILYYTYTIYPHPQERLNSSGNVIPPRTYLFIIKLT